MRSTNGLGKFHGTISDVTDALNDLTENTEKLLFSPLEFAQAVGKAVFALADLKALTSLSRLYDGYSKPLQSEETPSRLQEYRNQTAFAELVKTSCAARSAVVLSQKIEAGESLSPAEVDKTCQEITASLEQILGTSSDEVFASCLDLKAEVRHLRSTVVTASKVWQITLARPSCSLVLAYELYGSLDAEPDILARNRIAKPFAIRAGQTLEVLREA